MNNVADELMVLAPTDESYQILYQDDVLLVVDKPAKLLTVPGRHPANHDCLLSRVQREFPSAMVVHRLDYDTSGIVILPLTKRVLSDISKQFQARTVEKSYTAVVDGLWTQPEGLIGLPIAADPDNRPCYKICETTGKPSQTRFTLIATDNAQQQSRIVLQPLTGRSHQLRLHTRAVGHPILGDTLYALPEIQAKASRLLLHASAIRFCHPLGGKVLQLDAATPF